MKHQKISAWDRVQLAAQRGLVEHLAAATHAVLCESCGRDSEVDKLLALAGWTEGDLLELAWADMTKEA